MVEQNSIINAISNFIEQYQILSVIIITLIFIVLLIIVGIYLLAFFQNREISTPFGHIGQKPENHQNTNIPDNSKKENINKEIIHEINILFDQYEKDIEFFFEQAREKSSDGKPSSLILFTDNCREEFAKGKIFETNMYYPWDFTISVMDLSGKFLNHDYKPIVGSRMAHQLPWSEVLAIKNGTYCWVNSFKSESMIKIFPDNQYDVRRITKLHFREIAKVKAILTFELHLNILYHLPHISE